jgi:hypothetical protein
VKTFEYELAIEDARGRKRRTVRRIAFARPLVEHATTRRVYTWPRVYVRKAVKAQPARG